MAKLAALFKPHPMRRASDRISIIDTKPEKPLGYAEYRKVQSLWTFEIKRANHQVVLVPPKPYKSKAAMLKLLHSLPLSAIKEYKVE